MKTLRLHSKINWPLKWACLRQSSRNLSRNLPGNHTKKLWSSQVLHTIILTIENRKEATEFFIGLNNLNRKKDLFCLFTIWNLSLNFSQKGSKITKNGKIKIMRNWAFWTKVRTFCHCESLPHHMMIPISCAPRRYRISFFFLLYELIHTAWNRATGMSNILVG